MERVLKVASDWFWNEDIWLPPGHTWSSFQERQVTNNNTVLVEPEEFAQFSDLLYPLPLSVLLVLLRMAVTRTVFRPLASRLGLRSRADKSRVPDNALLETVHIRGRAPSHQELTKIAEQCGMTVIQVRFEFVIMRQALAPTDSVQHSIFTGTNSLYFL